MREMAEKKGVYETYKVSEEQRNEKPRSAVKALLMLAYNDELFLLFSARLKERALLAAFACKYCFFSIEIRS